MNELRVAGELNLTHWNSIRGTIRRWDYVDIQAYLLGMLRIKVEDKISEMEQSWTSRITNASDIATLKQMLERFDDSGEEAISFVLRNYEFDFPKEQYELVRRAASYCNALSYLYNRVKEHERGVLSSVFTYQDELYKINWLRKHKQELYNLTMVEYKDVLSENKR